MDDRFKVLARRLLPAALLRQVQGYRQGGPAADGAAAWDFKRAFFWNAFKALEFNGIDGDYAEFGSYGGMTFRLAFDQIRHRTMRRHMWAFDSFQGLPDASSPLDTHPKWTKGSMATGVDDFHRICRLHGISRESYTVVDGFYDQTLMADWLPANIALAYVDCDMYSSTKTVLQFLASRLKHGMIIAFDDYFCWSADQMSGERRALLEMVATQPQWNFVRYRDYGWAGASFLVERADLNAGTAPADRRGPLVR